MLNNLYFNIKQFYKLLEQSNTNEISLELQFRLREILNENIRLYKFYNGQKNIEKFMKYYV